MLVAAKCTQCGGHLQVDNQKEAQICEFCGAPFITEKAVENFNISNAQMNVTSAQINASSINLNMGGMVTVESLFTRANQFFSQGNYDRATEYYDRILDIDPEHKGALDGIENVQYKTLIIIGKKRLSRELTDELVKEAQLNTSTAIAKMHEKTKIGAALCGKYLKALAAKNFDLGAVNEEFKDVDPDKKEDCYIATAVYGSYDAPEVLVLRRFRDDTLSKQIAGRLFIKTYYFVSPPLADKLKNCTRINSAVRGILDRMVTRLANDNKECKN
jgi:tetratricopeptide (TPR) repeat protein